MRLIHLTLLLATAITISACGWQVRGWQTAPSTLEELELIAEDRYAPLTLSVLDVLQQRGIDNHKQAPLKLQLGMEKLSKRTVAVTSIGSPSQYEMSLSVTYRYYHAGETPQTTPSTASVHRVFDFDPSNTVAKTEEENTLLAEMRRELAHRILRNPPH